MCLPFSWRFVAHYFGNRCDRLLQYVYFTMKENDKHAHKQNSCDRGQEDSTYPNTLNQMYDTALASLHPETINKQRKKSMYRFDAEPKNDESSTSTASTAGHDEMYERFQAQGGDAPTIHTSFIVGVIRESTVNIKKGVSVRLQKSWKTIRSANKPIEVFLHEARYPSDVRTTC